jgi:PIN domain
MPTLSEKDIQARIADGLIAGITLDTSIFDRYGCNLKFPLLTSLDQFNGGAVQLVFSEIIISEVKRHIFDSASETLREVKKAVRTHKNRWKTGFDIDVLLKEVTASTDAYALAEAQVVEFVKALGANILPATDKVNVTGEVVRRYFSGEAPFEKKDAKKSEFPDAFALLSLESLFSQKQKMLLCVSADNGWAQFAENSEWLVVVNQLDAALSYFNLAGRHIADRAIQMLGSGSAPKFADAIELAIQARLDDLDFQPVSYQGLDYEAVPTNAAMQRLFIDSTTEPVIIAADDNEVTFTFSIDVIANFEAEFNFHAYDSYDKDYVHLSTEDASVEKSLSFELVVTVERKLDPEPVVIEAEVVAKFFEVDFGYVEPFPNEDPSHEKY